MRGRDGLYTWVYKYVNLYSICREVRISYTYIPDDIAHCGG